MEKDIMEMYTQFPHIIPHKDYKKWEGFLISEPPNLCQIVINTPNFPKVDGIQIFASNSDAVNKVLSSNNEVRNLPSLLIRLKDEIQSIVDSKKSTVHDLTSLSVYSSLLNHINSSIGLENVSIDSDMSRLTLSYMDSEGETHEITLAINKNYGSSPLAVLKSDLPDEFVSKISQKRDVIEAYEAFRETVESLLPFWSMCDRLGRDAWVVDPQKPSKKDIHRRLYINESLSILLTFNPSDWNNLPEVKFLGSLTSVSNIREKYQTNLQRSGWNPEYTVVENLCALLDLDALPSPPGNDDSTSNPLEAAECVICYEVETSDQSPLMKWCMNANCNSVMHHSCLMEWLNTVPTTKVCFDHVSGPCPHCDEKLFCPINV